MPEAAGFFAAASTPHGLITLLVFAASLVLFISGWLAPELTGLLAVALLVSFGVLDPQQAVKGFGSPALIIVEVGGNRNHCLSDGFSKIGFRISFELSEDHGRNLFGHEDFGFSLHFTLKSSSSVLTLDYLVGLIRDLIFHFVELSTDQAFGRKDSIGWISHSLSLGSLPNQHAATPKHWRGTSK